MDMVSALVPILALLACPLMMVVCVFGTGRLRTSWLPCRHLRLALAATRPQSMVTGSVGVVPGVPDGLQRRARRIRC